MDHYNFYRTLPAINQQCDSYIRHSFIIQLYPRAFVEMRQTVIHCLCEKGKEGHTQTLCAVGYHEIRVINTQQTGQSFTENNTYRRGQTGNRKPRARQHVPLVEL